MSELWAWIPNLHNFWPILRGRWYQGADDNTCLHRTAAYLQWIETQTGIMVEPWWLDKTTLMLRHSDIFERAIIYKILAELNKVGPRKRLPVLSFNESKCRHLVSHLFPSMLLWPRNLMLCLAMFWIKTYFFTISWLMWQCSWLGTL